MNDAQHCVSASVDSKDTYMEVDVAPLDHVMDSVTYGVLELVNIPISQRKASLMFFLVQHNNQWTHKGLKIPCHFHLQMKLVSCEY
jgi:hypothetical protein